LPDQLPDQLLDQLLDYPITQLPNSMISFHDFEQTGWQLAAGHYPDTFGTLTAQTTRPLLESAGVRPGTRVLDVATGPGYLAGAAAAWGATVVGLDFSPAMIAEARRRYPGIGFHEGDAEALPFDDGGFDAVVMNFGMLHLARPEAAIEQAYRVLTPGGRYAFTVWARPEEAVGFGVVLRAMETYGTTAVGLPDGPPFFRFSDPDECRRALAQAGFQSVDVHKLPLIWRLPSADALFEAALRGGVRTSAALQAQTPEALAAIRRAVHDELQQYADGSTIGVPMHVVLASAGKLLP
jgi:SAM-dependent methyltransferase